MEVDCLWTAAKFEGRAAHLHFPEAPSHRAARVTLSGEPIGREPFLRIRAGNEIESGVCLVDGNNPMFAMGPTRLAESKVFVAGRSFQSARAIDRR